MDRKKRKMHLCVVQDAAAERIVSGEASQLREELVAVDVVVPRLCHWPLEGNGVVLILTCGGNLLDSDNLGHCIDGVVFQGLDQSADRGLKCLSVLTTI